MKKFNLGIAEKMWDNRYRQLEVGEEPKTYLGEMLLEEIDPALDDRIELPKWGFDY